MLEKQPQFFVQILTNNVSVLGHRIAPQAIVARRQYVPGLVTACRDLLQGIHNYLVQVLFVARQQPVQSSLMQVGKTQRDEYIERLPHVRHYMHPIDKTESLLGLILEKLARTSDAARKVHQTFERTEVPGSQLLLQLLDSDVFTGVFCKYHRFGHELLTLIHIHPKM